MVLLNQHAIAVGVKAISLCDSVVVSVKNVFFSAERTYQHEKRGLGQVKIRKQSANYIEVVSRVDEKIGFARSSSNFAGIFLRGIFQSANGCRSYGHDAA